MDIQDFFEKINGQWKGTYRLWLDPTKDSDDSNATADIRFIANKNYLIMTYSWIYEGSKQEGFFLLGGDKNRVTATWGDSFHSSPFPMICEGALTDNESMIVLNGNYSWGEEKWGWRTEIYLRDSSTLVIDAYNISPELQEDIAARCEMERASNV